MRSCVTKYGHVWPHDDQKSRFWPKWPKIAFFDQNDQKLCFLTKMTKNMPFWQHFPCFAPKKSGKIFSRAVRASKIFFPRLRRTVFFYTQKSGTGNFFLLQNVLFKGRDFFSFVPLKNVPKVTFFEVMFFRRDQKIRSCVTKCGHVWPHDDQNKLKKFCAQATFLSAASPHCIFFTHKNPGRGIFFHSKTSCSFMS